MRQEKGNSKATLAYHYGVSVYAIVEKNGKILLTQDHYRPGWKLPGGGVEDRELLVDAHAGEVNFVAKAGSGATKPKDGEVEVIKWVIDAGPKSLRADECEVCCR